MNNLKSFHKYSVIKQAAMKFIGAQLITKKDKDECVKVFKALDKEANGYLTKKELKEGFE